MGDSVETPEAEPECSEQTPEDPPLVKKPCWVVRIGRFMVAHRLYYSGVLLAMVLVGFVGYGVARGWTVDHWGPFSEWLAGGLTLAAVIVALRESLRGQRARAVDHEVTRRRECLKAVGDVWTGLVQMSLYFTFFTDYLQNLPIVFDPNLPRNDNVPSDHPAEPIAYDIGNRMQDFTNRWTELVEPPLFVALALLKDTPFDEAMKDVNTRIRDIMEKELPKVLKIERVGRRPDISELDRKWKELLRNREEHLNLTRKHFSLDLNVVESQLRRGNPPESPTPQEAQG